MPEADDPRVAAHNVETTEMSHCVIHQPSCLVDLAYISLESHSITAIAFDLADNFFCCLARIGIVYHDLGTQAAELFCNSSTNATTRAGDQGHFAVKAVGNVCA